MNDLQVFVFFGLSGGKLVIPKDKIKEILSNGGEIYVNGHQIKTRFDIMELTIRIVNAKEVINIIN